MPPGDPADDAILAALRPALEAGLEHARHLAATEAAAVPRPLRPLLKHRGPTPQALRVVRSVVDRDDDFRAAVAAEAPDGDELAWMWLHRKPGWEWRLESVASEARYAGLLGEESRRRADAERQREQAEHERAVAEAARIDAVEHAERVTAEARRLDAELAATLEQLGVARAEREELVDRADSAGRRAQRAEATVGRERTLWRQERARWDHERSSLAAGQSEAPSAEEGAGGDADVSVDVEAARDAVRAAAEALGLPRLAPAEEAGGDHVRRAQVGRRRPVRPGRGLDAGSPEGVFALLAHDDIVVYVDGYNVAKRAWPTLAVDLQRDRLVDCLARVCARTGGAFEVVFDGADVVRPAAPRAAAGPVRVRFSLPDVLADDEILDRVAALDPAVPVAVVTSDREVQRGVAAHGANVIDADALIATFH